MKVTMMLADAVQAVNNKLYILGGGWSIIGPDPTPFGIAIKIEIPWDEANRQHRFELVLLDEDGHSVKLPDDRPVELGGEFEVGRPAGLKPGTPLDVALAINLGQLPIPPGRRYVWRCSIDRHSEPDWQVTFTTRPTQKPGPLASMPE